MLLNFQRVATEEQYKQLFKKFHTIANVSEWKFFNEVGMTAFDTFLVMLDKTFVGYIVLNANKGEIYDIYVMPNYRNKCLGKIMLYAVFCRFPNIQVLKGEVNILKGMSFLYRIGAVLARDMSEVIEDVYGDFDENHGGEYYDYLCEPNEKFVLSMPRFKAHLMMTNTINVFANNFQCDLNNIIWS